MKEYIVRKKWRVLFILLCLILIAWVLIYFIGTASARRGEFTQRAWDRHPRLRHLMVDDMERTIDLWNLPKDEIIDILGTNATRIQEYTTDEGYIQKTIWYSLRGNRRSDSFLLPGYLLH